MLTALKKVRQVKTSGTDRSSMQPTVQIYRPGLYSRTPARKITVESLTLVGFVSCQATKLETFVSFFFSVRR